MAKKIPFTPREYAVMAVALRQAARPLSDLGLSDRDDHGVSYHIYLRGAAIAKVDLGYDAAVHGVRWRLTWRHNPAADHRETACDLLGQAVALAIRDHAAEKP